MSRSTLPGLFCLLVLTSAILPQDAAKETPAEKAVKRHLQTHGNPPIATWGPALLEKDMKAVRDRVALKKDEPRYHGLPWDEALDPMALIRVDMAGDAKFPQRAAVFAAIKMKDGKIAVREIDPRNFGYKSGLGVSVGEDWIDYHTKFIAANYSQKQRAKRLGDTPIEDIRQKKNGN